CIDGLLRQVVVRGEFEFDAETVLVHKFHDIISPSESCSSPANVGKLGLAFPVSAKQVVEAHAQALFECSDLLFGLILQDLLIAVVNPAGAARIRLNGTHSVLLELGSLEVRESDRIDERLEHRELILAHHAVLSAADLRSDREITFAAESLDGLCDHSPCLLYTGIRRSLRFADRSIA